MSLRERLQTTITKEPMTYDAIERAVGVQRPMVLGLELIRMVMAGELYCKIPRLIDKYHPLYCRKPIHPKIKPPIRAGYVGQE